MNSQKEESLLPNPKIMTSGEAQSWCVENGFSDSAYSWATGNSFPLKFTIPNETWKVQDICTDLMTWSKPHNECLVWIKSWPFYKPEQMAIVKSMRAGWGEHRELLVAPGHLFKDKDSEVIGLFMLSLLFGWDAIYIPLDSEITVITYAHEGFGIINARTEELGRKVQMKLEELEIFGWESQ